MPKARSAILPLDVFCLKDSCEELHSLVWPTNYLDYSSLSNALTSTILKAIAEFTPNSVCRVLGDAKAYDITTDLALISRLAVDIANARSKETQILYNSARSPFLSFLDRGESTDRMPMTRTWHHPPDRHLGITLVKTMRRWGTHARALTIGKHDDILNRNYLLEDYLQSSPIRTINWTASVFSWREPELPAVATQDLAALLVVAFNALVRDRLELDHILLERLKTLGHLLINYHVKKASIDYTRVSRSFKYRKLGNRLLSGTPKHIGRLMGSLYQQEARPVLRFAHGGERAFYVDNEWGMAELVNCDVYYAHSAGEAYALQERVKDGSIAYSSKIKTIKFRSLGSNRHRQIYLRRSQKSYIGRTGTVMYVAGGFLGEGLADFPSRKPPDILYLDWQIALLKTLRKLGYEVITKLHPRGVMREGTFLKPYCHNVIKGFFNPLQSEVDCFIFDFAGSAFFDALASHLGMVLVDTAVRKFDERTKPHLLQRCSIVSARLDERGRFRVAKEELGKAVEEAAQNKGCSSYFYDTYIAA